LEIKYSVVIPTLNRSQMLRRAIDSVFAQPLDGNLEVVVVDNCSQDDTQQVLATPPYNQVRVIVQPRRVPRIENFMTALRAATGRYVAILYDDEEMLADNLQRKGQLLDNHPEVIAVTSSVAKRDAAGNLNPGVLVRPDFAIEARDVYLHNTFNKAPGGLPQVLMRRQALDTLAIDPRDEPLDDNAFVLRLSTLGAIATLPECLVTETVTDAEMVRTGLLELFTPPGQEQPVSLPAIWFGWSHYRMRVDHLLQSADLSLGQLWSLHRTAKTVFRRDVWKAAYWRWHVSKRPGPALRFLLRAAAFDPSLLVPPVGFFLRWKVTDTAAPLLLSDAQEVNPTTPDSPAATLAP
jgi:glycosyltransferase involved in cell wall biosynthesis